MKLAIKTVSATDVRNNFGKYLRYVMENGEVVILKNGRPVARLISEEAVAGSLTDSLRGVLKQKYTGEDERSARTEKYNGNDCLEELPPKA